MVSAARQPLRMVPFRATTYAPGTDLAAVVCPPYDVIGARALAEFEAQHPHNIVHLTLPRPAATTGDEARAAGTRSADPWAADARTTDTRAADARAADAQPADTRTADGGDRYVYAARELRRWREAGVLRRDPSPALYVYEHVTAAGSAIGLVGAVGIDGPVLPHESTFPGPVADRAALMRATRAQLEPILLTYDGDDAASDVVDAAAATAPDQEFTVGDEVHRVWRTDDPTALAAVADDLSGRSALIADGHHRFAAYRAVHAAGPVPAATDHGLALLVDAARHPLELRGIHRSVAGLPFDEAVAAAAKGFDVVPLGAEDDVTAVLGDEKAISFVIGDDRRRALLRSVRPSLLDDAVPAGRPEGWRELDSAVLVDVLLAYLWEVDDADGRVTYHHDGQDAFRAAGRSGGVAVLVRPPALADVLALAARGGRMPRKSTSFGPKPWTGLLMRELGADGL